MAALIAPGSDTVDADEGDESEEEDDPAAFFFAATPPFWMKGIIMQNSMIESIIY